MKTKNQVIEHLKAVGYSRVAINKIMGFLIGNGQKEIYEVMEFLPGDGTFEDFINWYQSETEEVEPECPVCKAFRHLFSAMDMAADNDDLETLDELDSLMNIMLDIFIVDDTEKEAPEQKNDEPKSKAEKPKRTTNKRTRDE